MVNQETLPLTTYGELAKLIGINWLTIELLYENKLLSFNPEKDEYTESADHIELIFIGSMIASDISLSMIKDLTSKLVPPYSYSHAEIYFDASQNCWNDKLKEVIEHEVAHNYIAELTIENDLEELEDLLITIKNEIKKESIL